MTLSRSKYVYFHLIYRFHCIMRRITDPGVSETEGRKEEGKDIGLQADSLDQDQRFHQDQLGRQAEQAHQDRRAQAKRSEEAKQPKSTSQENWNSKEASLGQGRHHLCCQHSRHNAKDQETSHPNSEDSQASGEAKIVHQPSRRGDPRRIAERARQEASQNLH
jgi:hypothetical protein